MRMWNRLGLKACKEAEVFEVLGFTSPLAGRMRRKAMAAPQHVPVLLEQSLTFLNVRPGGVVVDATLGLGGHSAAIARRLGGRGKLIAFDRDAQAMELAKAKLAALAEELGSEMPAVEFVARPISEIAEVVAPGRWMVCWRISE